MTVALGPKFQCGMVNTSGTLYSQLKPGSTPLSSKRFDASGVSRQTEMSTPVDRWAEGSHARFENLAVFKAALSCEERLTALITEKPHRSAKSLLVSP